MSCRPAGGVPAICRALTVLLAVAGSGVGASAADPADPPGTSGPASAPEFQPSAAGFGGPKSLTRELEVDNPPQEFYRLPIRAFRGWYAWKADLAERTGLSFNVNYTVVYVSASHAIGDAQKWAAGGILDLIAGWTLVGRGGSNPGTLYAKLGSRHSIASDAEPMFLGFDTGYYGLPAVGFRDYSVRFNELNWQQVFWQGRLTAVAGKVDATNYLHFHGLIVPWRHYLGYGTSVSGTVNWPDQGWGIVAGGLPSERTFVTLALTDARGDVFRDGEVLYGGSQFGEGNFFSAIEVGYVPSLDERFFRKISLMLWHTPEFTEDGSGAVSGEAQGAAFSAHWYFQDRYIPLLRFGVANGVGINSFYESDVQIGLGRRFLSHDILGLSASWAQPNLPGAKDQYTAEVFYRFVVTQHLELTPDLQLVFNPSLNPDRDVMTYAGVRTRLTF